MAKDVILSDSQKFITKQSETNMAQSNFQPARKLHSEQRYKQATPMRQIRTKNTKFNDYSGNYQKIDSSIRIHPELKFNENSAKKGQFQSLNLTSAKNGQKLAALPLPKKISSAAFIIYEVFADKNKSYSKKFQFQLPKKKEVPGKIHASFNIKSASEIASLTKIMTCIVVI